MSVFDLEKIKEELSVHDPLMPCVIKALRVIGRLCEEGRKLETENTDLKLQVTEAICHILTNRGVSMIDCRMCFFYAGSLRLKTMD